MGGGGDMKAPHDVKAILDDGAREAGTSFCARPSLPLTIEKRKSATCSVW